MAVSQYFAILEISARAYELNTWLSVGDNEVQSQHSGECNEGSPPAHDEHDEYAQYGPGQTQPHVVILQDMREVSEY